MASPDPFDSPSFDKPAAAVQEGFARQDTFGEPDAFARQDSFPAAEAFPQQEDPFAQAQEPFPGAGAEEWGQQGAVERQDSQPAPVEEGKGGKEGYVQYRALYDYEARNDDELPFQVPTLPALPTLPTQVGDIIQVHPGQDHEPGWLGGELAGKVRQSPPPTPPPPGGLVPRGLRGAGGGGRGRRPGAPAHRRAPGERQRLQQLPGPTSLPSPLLFPSSFPPPLPPGRPGLRGGRG